MTDLPPRLTLTGPTGWIGTAFLDTLRRARGRDWTRGVTLFGSSPRTITAPDSSLLEVRPLESITAEDVDGANLVHLAALTKDKVQVVGPAAFFATNTMIDAAVLSACDRGRPRSIFVASSGAAKQAESGQGRELYGLCKLMQEDAFLGFGARTGVPVTTGRIFNLAGPFINKLDAYAVSALLRQALHEGAARIEARTPVYRAYLHVQDLCALVMGMLAAGLGHTAPLDLAGCLTVEMEDVACEALRATGHPDGRIIRAPVDWDRPSIYLGDPTGARTLALRFDLPLRSFAEQVDDTAADLRQRTAPL